MMKGRVAPSAMATLIQVGRQSVDIPHVSSPQERQMRKQRQKIKREHDIRSPKVEEHLPTKGDIYED
jgi:hypothetical protein